MDPKEETEEFYDCPEICSVDDYDKNWAKEKASMIWLLSKAFGGTIPSDFKEPFYRDKDNVRRLKPKIVHSLANAELYSLALVNIYSDPNYHNLDHQGIIQALMRKGICLVESRDAPLTETVLVQTAPIRMHAHMSVIDGMMSLYIKEVLIPEKIVQAVREFSYVDINSEMPSNPEEAAVLWINKCCITLEEEIRSGFSTEEECRLPKIPVLQEISDISDGCSLAAVLSFYCPNHVRWQDICWNDPMSLGDSIYNLQIIKKFCSEYLPHNINFLTLEDFLYLHPSIKDNILVFIADLLYMFVIWKVNCVTRLRKSMPLESSQIPLESSKSLSNFPTPKTQVPCSPIPNLRSDSYGGSTTSLPDIRPRSRSRIYGSKECLLDKLPNSKNSSLPNDETVSNLSQRTSSANVVNGWKVNSSSNLTSSDYVDSSPRHSVPCISTTSNEDTNLGVIHNISPPKNKNNNDLSFTKRMSPQAKTNFDQSQMERTTYSPQNVQKEPANYGLRKFSEDLPQGFRSMGDCGQANFGKGLFKGRKSLEDYYNQLAKSDGPLRSVSASNIIDSKSKRKSVHDKCPQRSRGDESVPESASSHSSGICLSDLDHKNLFSTTSFAELSKLRDASNSINIVYMQHEKEGAENEKTSLKSTFLQGKKAQPDGKKTTFAALPNTTTWQQHHAINSNSPQTDSGHETPTESGDNLLNAQLCNVRMKLEDKKRKIELKKKRMELLWKKQRQKLGKAAFLQAVSKGGGSDAGTPDSGTEKDVTEAELPPAQQPAATQVHNSPSLVKRMSIQDIAEDLDNVQKKWLAQNETVEASKHDSTPDLAAEVGDGDKEAAHIDFQTSIAHLNMSLTDLQADISRISLQQEQVESLMKDSVEDSSHFFLHTRTPNNELQPNSPLGQSFNFDESYVQQCNKRLFHEPNHNVASPQHTRNTYKHNILDVQMPLSSLPVESSRQPKEELYSKVIKPENRQKSRYLNSRPVVTSPVKLSSKDNLELKGTSYDLYNRQDVLPKQDFLPQMPEKYIKVKKAKEVEQGFYVSLDKEPKRGKPKTLRNGRMDYPKGEMNGPRTEPTVVPKPSNHEATTVNRTTAEGDANNSFGFVIGADLVHPDPEAETEMARKREMIMHMSIQRKAEYERKRAEKERELAKIKEEERLKQEYHERRREEERRRRECILEQYRQRKVQEEIEREGGICHQGGKDSGKSFAKPRMSVRQVKKRDNRICSDFTKPVVDLRNHLSALKQPRRESKPRPRSAYIPTTTDPSSLSSMDYTAANKRNSQLIYSGREINDFDLDSLNSASTSTSSRDRTKSPNDIHHQLLLPQRGTIGLQVPDGPSSDGASDTASNGSSAADYNGPKLFVKPAAKSNRGIITNAINTVLAGAVNADMKRKVIEEINRSESKHFLILFRDAGCQFRALYSYNPDREEIIKLYGIGPKNITDKMMDRFYKYNSGGKSFSEIQTKHLTVTIDAFTIPNSLWAGKKNILPKKEFF